MKRVCETLATGAALAIGAVLLTGCGGAASAPDVPAVTEAKPSGAAGSTAAPAPSATTKPSP